MRYRGNLETVSGYRWSYYFDTYIIRVVGVIFFSHSLPKVPSGQTQKKVDFPSMHSAPFLHLFGLQPFANSDGLVGASEIDKGVTNSQCYSNKVFRTTQLLA